MSSHDRCSKREVYLILDTAMLGRLRSSCSLWWRSRGRGMAMCDQPLCWGCWRSNGPLSVKSGHLQ